MSKVKLICSNPICRKEFWREKKEHNRSLKIGRPEYCSRTCNIIVNNKNPNRRHITENLISNNRRDEFSQFRWFMKCCKRRSKEKGPQYRDFNLTLLYLKKLWESQNGVCPYTGWTLHLPCHSSRWQDGNDKITRASLDRIDSNIGYIKGNVQFVAVIYNYAKNEFSDEVVSHFCKSIVDNL